MNSHYLLPLLLATFALSACAPNGLPSAEGPHRDAVLLLRNAETKSLTSEQRAALYLESARQSSTLLASSDEARLVYNKAVADLTTLLRTSESGGLWNRPLTLTHEGTTYRLRLAPGNRQGVWDPGKFTAFTPASEVDLKTIKTRNRQDGVGAALVGIRKTDPLEPFSPWVGVTAPVTAVVDFKGNEATLTLIDPTLKTQARVAGIERPLDADFSAPLAYYPQKSELWEGLMGAMRVSHYMGNTGLYMLQPYDPDRIPLIFVHGLISTPRMWRNVINEIETDPVLRTRYQCWVFSYPTGNPPLYSALRLRDELEKVKKLYPDSKPKVLVGHSMGGILSHAQVTTVERHHWNVVGEDKASLLFKKGQPGDLIDRATTFEANPHIARAVFICTPHRGSDMAIGTLGGIGRRLISLPGDIFFTTTNTLGEAAAVFTGDSNRLPTSVDGLSPRNPTLKVLDTRPIQAPHHSIIGDRGKGDTPESSDGVVAYWSSNQETAKSQKIVPGAHGSCELPETLDELRRILRLHIGLN
jgi:pimeloyl-ACP methyl ester carboxylesterase